MDKYYRIMYKMLHIYQKYHISYRYFKKISLKRLNEYKKILKEAFVYINMENIKN